MTKLYRPVNTSKTLWPIGSVYLSVNPKSPADLFGGTWTQVQGYYLLAWYEDAGKMGGSWYTNETVLTVDQMPNHAHWGIIGANGVERMAGYGTGTIHTGTINEMTDVAWESLHTGSTGGGKGHNHYHEVPWFKVYCWYRTS